MQTVILLIFIVLVFFAVVMARDWITEGVRDVAREFRGGRDRHKTDRGDVDSHQRDRIVDFVERIMECVAKLDSDGTVRNCVDKEFSAAIRVDELEGEKPYSSPCMGFSTVHNGQLKLLVGEVMFYQKCLRGWGDSGRDRRPVFLYCGSAPNHKGSIINGMFPAAITIMVDPAEHWIKKWDATTSLADTIYLTATTGDRFKRGRRQVLMFSDGDATLGERRVVHGWRNEITTAIAWAQSRPEIKNIIIEDLFDEHAAEIMRGHVDFFLSDIRTNSADERGLFSEESPGDLDVLWNNAMTLLWLDKLRPRMCMIKMRLPYWSDKSMMNARGEPYASTFARFREVFGCDVVADYRDRVVRFVDGEDYIQAFAGTSSGETRLVFTWGQGADDKNTPGATARPPLIKWDYMARERRLFSYNISRRQYGFHVGYAYDPVRGIDACGDCALAVATFGEHGRDWLNRALDLLAPLTTGFHGGYFTPYKTVEEVTRFVSVSVHRSMLEKDLRQIKEIRQRVLPIELAFARSAFWNDRISAEIKSVVGDSLPVRELLSIASLAEMCADIGLGDMGRHIYYKLRILGVERAAAGRIMGVFDRMRTLQAASVVSVVDAPANVIVTGQIGAREHRIELRGIADPTGDHTHDFVYEMLSAGYSAITGARTPRIPAQILGVISNKRILEISRSFTMTVFDDTASLDYTAFPLLIPAGDCIGLAALLNEAEVVIINAYTCLFLYEWIKIHFRGMVIAHAATHSGKRDINFGYTYYTPYVGDPDLGFWATAVRWIITGPPADVSGVVRSCEKNELGDI